MSRSNSITWQVDEILTAYSKDVHGVLETALEEEAEATAKLLKQTSPKRVSGTKRGAYARSWRVSQRRGSFIVHNAKHYRLAHLLENGHVIKNGVGTYGRTRPIKHIEPAVEAAEMKLPLRIEARLKKL